MQDVAPAKTSSLQLAAYALTQGEQLLRTERAADNSSKLFFVFRRSHATEDIFNDFLLGRAGHVNVYSFLDAQKRLKNLLREAQV